MERIYLKAAELINAGVQAAIATITAATEGTPRKIGTKMLVMKDGSIIGTIGGGMLEKEIIDESLRVISTGQPVHVNQDLSVAPGGIGAVCGGQISIFVEPIINKASMYIFGGGHVGKAIAEMAQYLDFALNIADSRSEWLNKNNYPMECRFWSEDEFTSASAIETDKNSVIIVLTRSWKLDEGIVKRVLRKPFAYLGVIGSGSKIATLHADLEKEGFTKEELARINAPIGLPIGAYSPHEIAISILGEIIAVQKGIRDNLPRL